MRRFNTGWSDGLYTLPAGHVDGNETIAQSMSREILEETGLIIDPKNLDVVHVVHQQGNKEYIDFYLLPKKWQGKPKIMEPNKCDDMQWFPLSKLPNNTLPNVLDVLKHLQKKEFFSEFNLNLLSNQVTK